MSSDNINAESRSISSACSAARWQKGDWISPEQQIANVEGCLTALRQSGRHNGRTDAIRATERQLSEMREAHARGELKPIQHGGVPF